MPGGHIFNKDGTRMIKVRNTAQTPDALTTAHDTHSNGVSTEAVAGPANTAAATGATGSKKKKKKGRNKGMASHHDSHFDTASHGSHTNNGASHHHHHYHDDFESSKQGDGDDIYYTDEEPQFHDHISNGPSMHPADDAEAPTSKKNKKKKKKKAGQGATGAGVIPEVGHGLTAEVSRNSAQKSSRDRIWNTSTSEERERIKSFWLGLGEEERRSLVKVEKEAVLKKMKEQQKHSCSCSVCGRKRTAIEEELEVLYDAYYEELEHPKGLPSPHRRIDELSEIDDDEEHYETDEEYEDISEDSHRNVQQDFFNFGNSLTVRGGILTVADDLLKNDGKKFIEMMEQLAERRMAREEEASQHSHNLGGQLHSGMQHNHSHMPNGNQEYDIEEEDEDYDDDEEDYEDDEDEEPDTMTEEQRMEEGRRMFQIFAARMFEQRVLSAYREEVAKERQNKLLEELEAEKVKEQQALERKARQQEKKKDKKKALKEQKENDRKEKEARKAEEEAAQRAEEERKAEEARRRKEEQRLKREAEKKAAEEERLRKEEERKKRLQEEKEREQERERKRREQQERERKKKEEQTRKLKEEKEQRDREKREKDERDRKDRDARRKAAEDKERELKEQRDQKERERERDRAGNPSGSSSVVIPKIATTPILATTTTIAASSPLLHNLHPPAIIPAVVSPRLAVATPALPKHTSPGKGKSSASARGSVASSPQTPKIQLRAHTTAANVPLNSSSMAAASSAIPQAVQLPTNPPPGLLPPGVTVSPGNVGKRGLGQPATNPLQSAIQPISNHVSQIPPAPGLSPGAPMTTIHGGFPTHIAPPPGVPHPDPFSMSIPNQAPFVPHGHRPPQSPFPPQPFGMANTYRGFPGVHNMNPPPLVPPPGGLRNDFPPGGRGIFGGGDFSSLQQPMPASSFPVAPGSPFMRQENVVPTGHHRHPSNESNEIHHSVSTPKPIHRPTPIQRPPSHLVARDPISKANIDELSTSLGSSALLGDDDEPIDYRDNQLPIRRASIIGQGRAAGFAMPSGPSSFFPPESRHSPFGGLPSPSTHAPQMNTWGTASSPLFSSNAVTAWGSPSSGPGWGDPRVLHGHHNRRPTRIDTLRILAIRAITNVGPPTKDPEGYVSVEDMHRLLVDSGEVTVGLGLSDEELATVTEVEGDHVNGNGYFGHRRDDNGKITRVSFVAGDIRRRVSSAAGLVGTPVIKPAPLLPFEQRINPNLLEDEAL